MAAVRFSLYLITDGTGDWMAGLQAALSVAPAGRVSVQLRNRALPGRELLALAHALRALTRAHGAALLINDRVDVALAAEADGVHLPGHGLPLEAARRLLGKERLISAAAHCRAEAQALESGGADCVTFGPIWKTPSKPEDDSVPLQARVVPVGTVELAATVAALRIPLFALGGVDSPERAAACAKAGARIACLRGVLGRPDPAAATRAMLAVLAL